MLQGEITMSKPFQMMSQSEIDLHMKSLLEEGLNAGMSQAAMIRADQIVVDERVLVKCMYCSGYGNSLGCPPFVIKPSETRELLRKYQVGIIYRKLEAPERICGPEANLNQSWARQLSRDVQETMATLEGKAFYKGFYLALAFGGGRCKLCSLDGRCKGLKTRTCLRPFEKKPAMEAVGIDVYSTLRELDWTVSVVGKETDPKTIEAVGYCGLLLVY
jgi:predicted metal-binding protein